MKENSSVSICLAKKCSACCTDSQIRLTPKEYEFMQNGGTRLIKKYVASGLWEASNFLAEPADGKTTYELNGACGYLKNGLCEVYDDPRRPEICEDTDPGGDGCNSCRIQHGLQPIILYSINGYD